MVRDIDELLTSEMTEEEFEEFRQNWINEYAHDLVIECGESPENAMWVAEYRFEDFSYTMRDEMICVKRSFE